MNVNAPEAGTTHDPTRNHYAPAYDDPAQESARLVRCLQQQIEDCFTTISRIERLAPGASGLTWRTLRDGLRCWRAAIRQLTN